MGIVKKVQDIFYTLGLIIKRVRPENNTWLQNRGIESVIDIGANIGQFAERIHTILPQAKIYSFEPIKACHQQLLTNTAQLNIKTFNCALGDNSEELEINVSKHAPSSSMLEMADLHKDVFAGTDYIQKEKITVKRLDDVFPELGKLGKFMVKIDVQGFEDRVIKGGSQTLKKADLILIETTFQELYHGQLLFNGIYDLLSDLGFEFKGNYTQTLNAKDGSILYAESLFSNTNKS